MQNIMMINEHKALIQYDPELNMFRGEFVGLNGGADFYGDSIATLENEGKQSLQTFLEVCQENAIEPYKSFSGKSLPCTYKMKLNLYIMILYVRLIRS